MNECELLTKMAEILGPNGEHWTTGIRRSYDSESYCLVGAFEVAKYGETAPAFHAPHKGRPDPYQEAEHSLPTLMRLLPESVQDGMAGMRLSRFNDTNEYHERQEWTTVKDTLTKAIGLACEE